MGLRAITKLTAQQQDRLAEVKEAIEDEDLILDIDGLHPLTDQLVGTVECPFEGWRTRDLMAISLFVFDRAPQTVESIAADYALHRDTAYGLKREQSKPTCLPQSGFGSMVAAGLVVNRGYSTSRNAANSLRAAAFP